MKVFYSSQYVGSAHAFDTTRKAERVATSLTTVPMRAVELLPPPSALVPGSLFRCTPRRTSMRSGLACPDPLPSRRASIGTPGCGRWCSRQTGAPSPRHSRPSGLVWPAPSPAACTMHGASAAPLTAPPQRLQPAARAALAAGAASVLDTLDLDAHCGGGTASLIAEEPRIWQLDVSVCDTDSYESCERVSLRMVREADEYLGEIQRGLRDVQRWRHHFDLCL